VSRRRGGWRERGRRCASAGDGPAQIRMQSIVNSRRGNVPEHGEDMGTENRRQGHLGASKSTNLAAVLWSSGEGFAQPGGVLGYGRRGERQRGSRPSYRRGIPLKRQGNKGN
jgi:hypothetical protein